ncbi:MAG: amidohydrolase [Alphaproteobacteria bacterium]|jgi:aminobenzoyl-glutamate utilization protein A|nr:amidohydrolase [Alphaproteobacteria bacterium]
MSNKLEQDINALAEKLNEKTIACRRDLHMYPEVAWTEFRTAATVATELKRLGYEVLMGSEAIEEKAMMGVPSKEALAKHQQRAIDQGANAELVKKMDGGKTGVVGILKFSKPGNTVALRFDMDALNILEANDDKHFPTANKFASANTGVMHACGHDGHTSVGLAIAEIFANLKDELSGTIKLIFQPGEEGVKGANAMVSKGIVDDVNYLLGFHFGFKTNKTGMFACNITDFLATSKIDATFTGKPSHAGAFPEEGKNAVLAAACATINLHAISRHGAGASRINVGVFNGGSSRNIIADKATIQIETRGTTSSINEFMKAETHRMIKAAAMMHDVSVETTEMGGASAGQNSAELTSLLGDIAKSTNLFNHILDHVSFGASEDFSSFMERVQEKGGQAAYMMIGTNLPAQHHDHRFDIDEASLINATKMVAIAASKLLSK